MKDIDLNLHPRQGQALLTPANEILYGGAAGGGKSHLMRVLAILLCSMVPNLQVYIFRRHFSDLYKNHMEGPSSFVSMLWPLYIMGLVKINFSDNKIVFWNRATIHLCHCQHEKDVMKYQGSEIHVLLMDELTHFTEKMYRFLRNRVRLGGLEVPDRMIGELLLKDKLPMIMCGSNPGGVGHTWVKRTFVDYAPPFEVNRTRKADGGMLRAYIPAKLEDNPTLLENDPDYVDRLEGLGDPALVKAMKHGDWNIVSGGALDDVWKDQALIIERFKIPKDWKVDRSFDWGSSHPFSVGWWAESNGEEVEVVRKVWEGDNFVEYREYRSFPPGSLIRIHEWYGTKEVGTNEGIKLTAKEIATGIKDIEAELRRGGWIKGRVRSGPADGQIFQQPQRDVDTIAHKMEKEGIYWNKADKSPGSRVNGLELVRGALKNSLTGEGPGLYFMRHCRSAIGTLPVLPRSETNPEDVNTKAEDHVYDDVRYRILANAHRYSKVETKYAK